MDRLKAEAAERARQAAIVAEEVPVDIEAVAYTEILTDKH